MDKRRRARDGARCVRYAVLTFLFSVILIAGGALVYVTVGSTIPCRDRKHAKQDAGGQALPSGSLRPDPGSSSADKNQGARLQRRARELEAQAAKWSTLLASAEVKTESLEKQLNAEKARTAQMRSQVKRVQLASLSGAASDAPTDSARIGAAPDTSQLPPLKIYVYDMPSEFTTQLLEENGDCKWDSPFTWQTKYSLETYMHEELLKSPLRTLQPEEAHLFYVPLYVSCYLHHIGTNFYKANAKVKAALAHIRENYPYWDRSRGRDHVFTFTHDIGGCIAPYRPMSNAIFITNTGELRDREGAYARYTGMYADGYAQGEGANHQGDGRDLSLPCFSPWKDIVAPPMITDASMLAWQREHTSPDHPSGKQARTTLASFRGTIMQGGTWRLYSRGIRQRWLEHYGDSLDIKITNVHPSAGFGKKAPKYQETYRSDMLTSKYCLCPPGWATWTPRLYESLLLGCIPAIVADDNVLPFSRHVDYSKFTVHVPEAKAEQLQEVLPTDAAVVTSLQQEARLAWPAFVYHSPPMPGDAFYHLVHELFWRARSLGLMQGYVRTGYL